MKKFSITLFSLFLLSNPASMQADWTKSLGNIQKTDSIQKSYLLGMLTGKSYGIYKVGDILFQDEVVDFYNLHQNALYWSDENQVNSNLVSNMIEAIRLSKNEGLDPHKYHLNDIVFLYKRISNGLLFNSRDITLATSKLDILLTDAFLSLARDLSHSEIDYKKFQSILAQKTEEDEIAYHWNGYLKKYNYLTILDKAKQSGNVIDAIYALAPYNELYNNLKIAYNRYKEVVDSGGFREIKAGKTLKLGVVSSQVRDLRIRLSQSEDLDYADEDNKKFDKEVQTALKKFQRRVGIWASGVLNKTTRKALNVSAKKRLAKIKLNLERARWEKDEFQERYILVNIPEFKMRFMDMNKELYSARVIVGRQKNPTPIFQAKMSYVVLNPRWSVPNSIVVKELLEHLQEDPYYLEDRNYKMYNSWKKDRKELDAFDVDWFQYDEESKIPFNIVKEPGKQNPLGNVKFMFPNNYAVYMHDTPKKSLFKKPVRAFSHGCIRLHRPDKFLEFISNNYMENPYEEVKTELETGENKSLNLNDKIPIYIRYYTAFVDENGGVIFTNDIYGYDKIHNKLLQK